MTSTHSANPICAAAALANLRVIRSEGLVDNAARLAPILAEGCERICRASGGKITHWASTGLVGALQTTHPGTTDPNPARGRINSRLACQIFRKKAPSSSPTRTATRSCLLAS